MKLMPTLSASTRNKRRSKTKKFLSISFSASRWRGGGRRREKNARKFFGFCTRESASVSEAHCIASPRAPRLRRGLLPTFRIRKFLSAEREGFEPSRPFNGSATLAVWCFQPLSHLSILIILLYH